jgi:hypothetical protein
MNTTKSPRNAKAKKTNSRAKKISAKHSLDKSPPLSLLEELDSHCVEFDEKDFARFCPRPPLRLFAAGVPFVVRVAAEEPIADDGSALWAFTDFQKREIVLSPDLPMIDRSRTIRHEYFHAWCMIIPRPRTEEDMAIVFAAASEAFDNQINAEGGNSVIYNMRPAPDGKALPPKARH